LIFDRLKNEKILSSTFEGLNNALDSKDVAKLQDDMIKLSEKFTLIGAIRPFLACIRIEKMSAQILQNSRLDEKSKQ